MKRTILAIGVAIIALALGHWWLGESSKTPRRQPMQERSAIEPESTKASDSPLAIASVSPQQQESGSSDRAAVSQSAPVLSAVVQAVLQNGRKPAQPSELSRLTAFEEATLIETYRRIESITNKLGIAWTLAYAGGADAFDVLQYAVVTEYHGRQFDHPRETSMLGHVVWYIGMLAERDDRALAFLQAGVSPEFWRTNITWSGPGGEMFNRLPGFAIKGLAVSGRPEGWQAILNLASNPPPRFAHYGEIALAAYYHQMLQRHGKAWVWENCPGNFDAMFAWFRTESGRPWFEWWQRMDRIGAR